MVIGVIDIIVLVVLVLSVLVALYRGLVAELLSISSWIIAGFSALYSYTPMTPLMQKYIEDERLAGPCGALLIGLLVLVVMTVINAQITKRLRNSSLSGLDRMLGFAFGFLRAVLLISLIYVGATSLISEKQIQELSKENVTLPYVKKSAEFLKYFVPKNVQADLKLPTSDSTQTKEQPKIGTDLKRIQAPKKTEQDSFKSLVKEVMKKEVKKEVTKEVKKKTQEVTKKTQQTSQTPAPVKYDSKQRQSLDNMVESLTKDK